MHNAHRVLGSVSSLAMALALSACGTPSGSPTTTAQSKPGVTRITEMYGPECNRVPLLGLGSPAQMVHQPVGVAMGNTPLLTQVSGLYDASGLNETLNKTGNDGYTVFAPAGSALEPLFHSGALNRLRVNDAGALRKVLGYQVVPKRYDAHGLLAAGTVTTLEGSPLTISGDNLDLTIGDQHAHVLCGDIPTANATIFVIDKLLQPPAPPTG